MRKPAIAALTISITIVTCLIYLAVWCYLGLKPYDVHGPRSPQGLQVIVHVSDCGPSWGADYYCDVTVREPGGKVVATWKDDDGQVSKEGVESFVGSMKWIDADTLQFEGVRLKASRQ